MLYSRISSGLEFLDAAVGGLYSNRCYLLRGPSESGRTTFALQFLLAGLESGENGLMISSDRIEDVVIKADRVGISLEQYIVDNRLALMEYPPEILNGEFQYGGIINLLGEIENSVKMYHSARLAVDTLIPLLVLQEEQFLVNYIYSLVNAFDEMHTTTLFNVGDPTNPTALRMIQLLEDAVVGSFALSHIPTKSGVQRVFAVHKFVNRIAPPTTFKVKIDFGEGLIPELAAEATPTAEAGKTIALNDVLLHVYLLDSERDSSNQIKRAIHQDSSVSVFESEEEFAVHIFNFDCDLLVINAQEPSFNWQQIVTLARDSYPKLPIFVITGERNSSVTFQTTRQAGADALFYKPLHPEEMIRALEKTLRGYGTYDQLVKRVKGSGTLTNPTPEASEATISVPGVDSGLNAEANLVPLSKFKELMTRQIWTAGQTKNPFSLASFKVVTITQPGQPDMIPQGLEIIKRAGMIVTGSLRGLNDVACRYMDKIVVQLESCYKDGAKAYLNRALNELKTGISQQLGIQYNKNFYILYTVASYPEDGDNVNDLLYQVTDVSKNFIKSLN